MTQFKVPDAPAMGRPKRDPDPMPPPTMTNVDLMALIIVETWDDERCAQLLADDFPDASRDDVLAAIDETEPAFLSMGFGGLSQLRKQVERVHPAWRT
jgi:hypothetical protein